MPLPFVIPAALSGALRHWKLAGLALLLLAIAVQTVRHQRAVNRAERAEFNLREARAELVRISTAKDEQGKATERNIEKARDGESEARRVSDRIRNAPVSGKCETPAEILQAEI